MPSDRSTSGVEKLVLQKCSETYGIARLMITQASVQTLHSSESFCLILFLAVDQNLGISMALNLALVLVTDDPVNYISTKSMHFRF